MSKSNTKQKCNFCGKSSKDVNMLINGKEAKICDSCTLHANQIVADTFETEVEPLQFDFDKKPNEIVEFLDQYIISQEIAKKTLSVAVYNHYKRIGRIVSESEVEIEKSNVLLIGNTGTGKTLLAKTIAKLLNVPFAIADATAFTQSGYVGEDIESVISRLLQNCNYDINSAEKGIVFIDEIDKISRKGENPSITRDVGGEGVQQGLLKLLEGSEVLVPPQGGRKHPEQPFVKVNTQNILFICGGAFDGIEEIINKRLNTSKVGFKNSVQIETVTQKDNILIQVNSNDIKQYGLIPELIGRLPVITALSPLDRKTYKAILTQPKNAILKQYQELLKMEGIELVIKDSCLDFIVDRAMEYSLGARGLRTICEKIMLDIMYDAPNSSSKKIVLDKKLAEKNYYRNQNIKKTA